jgi:hypothetical protein
MVNENKVGTEANPIKLVQENSKRPKLEKYSTLKKSDLGTYDFGKYKEIKYKADIFNNNLVFNPHLSANEIRLGFLIYELIGKEDGSVFWLTSGSDSSAGDIGDLGFLNIVKTRNTPFDIVPFEYKCLPKIMKSYKLDMTKQEIIAALNTLHDFYFITCTEISEQNLASNTTNYNYITEGKELNRDSKVVHLRINHGMDEIYVVDKWVKAQNNLVPV